MNPTLGDFWILTAVLWRLVQDDRDSQYFQGQKSKGEKSNWKSMSGNQTHQWKEHFWHGGLYLLPPAALVKNPTHKRRRAPVLYSTFTRPDSLRCQYDQLDQMGLNEGLHPYDWSWAAISPGQPSVSWLSPLTAEVVANERMIKHSARFKMVSCTRHSTHSRWNKLHQAHNWDWSYRSGCRRRPESQNIPSEIRFNPDYMAPVTSLYPNGKRPLNLHA